MLNFGFLEHLLVIDGNTLTIQGMVHNKPLFGAAVAEQLGLGRFQQHSVLGTILLCESHKELEAVEAVGY